MPILTQEEVKKLKDWANYWEACRREDSEFKLHTEIYAVKELLGIRLLNVVEAYIKTLPENFETKTEKKEDKTDDK